MNPRTPRHAGPSALEWIEAALHLLRARPAVLLSYYLGSVPCLLSLLFFWADMSQGAFARAHLIESSLGVAALYLWMKCWQTVFASKLRAQLLMEPEAPWTAARITRLALVQSALQPFGLFLRLLAAQILLPYIWTYAFFQSAGILGDGTNPSVRAVLRAARKQAGLWWQETHLALLCLFGFAFFIWLNVTTVCALLPFAFKTFLGIETPLTRNVWAMFNSTFFAATFAATYLCFDPLRKAVFVLRQFHGDSRLSGDDLRVGLKALRRRVPGAAAALALVCAGLGATPLTARAAEPPPARVESTSLNESLDRVLQQREYAWRLPREAGPEEQDSWLATFFKSVGKKLFSWIKQVGKVLGKIVDWLRDLFEPAAKDHAAHSGGLDWPRTARWTLIVLVAALAGLLGVLLWRWRESRRGAVATAQPLASVPDLNEESVTADQLPEDGWLQLARELMERGERRLALRASYLAGLAHLGHRELLRIARHKSNRDYDRELRRRARGNTSLLDAFDENLEAFERSWYGEHAVTPDTLGSFSQNLERIRAC